MLASLHVGAALRSRIAQAWAAFQPFRPILCGNDVPFGVRMRVLERTVIAALPYGLVALELTARQLASIAASTIGCLENSSASRGSHA